MAIDSQRISQTPSVKIVGFGSARRFPVPVTLRAFWIHRINSDPALQKLFNGRTLTGLDGYGQVRVSPDQFLPFLPTLGGVFKGEVLNNFALLVHDHHVVVILSPVKAGIMGN